MLGAGSRRRDVKVVSWNLNSINTRLERLLALLERHQPDVVCLQETKVVDEKFPTDALRDAGYHAVVHGQRTYNGVAILSRTVPTDVRRALTDDDEQARLISAVVDGVRVVSAYVPNGSTVGSSKFAYKLRWMAGFLDLLGRSFSPDDPLLVCGDFNVTRDDADVARPEEWASSVLCAPEVRAAMEEILGWGLVDVFREKHPEGGIYSWWDYRMLGFPKGNGLRIDYVLASPPMAARCEGAAIDRDERKGQKPSDHAPVVAVFE